MRKTMNRIILGLSVLFYAPVGFSYLSTEATQIFNNFELAQGVIAQIETFQAIERDLRWTIQNTRQYATEFKRAPLLTFSRLFATVKRDGGIAASLKGRIERIDRRYPGYLNYLLLSAPEQASVVYGDWSQAINEELETSMESIGINMKEVETEAQMLKELEKDSLDAEGRLEALQIGHQIALTGLQQNVRLQKLIQEQIKLTQVFLKDLDSQRTHRQVDNQRISSGLGKDPYGSDKFCAASKDC